ncbi:hypothetical protein PybrP1_011563 [[Pythium] brassicae (nom. inval.)]|nr:hypothetical protein PybrP1_011563 [[Pythium] brassicae (nom. inval.)]
MVLMRRKDKRRGNEAEEIVVASDSSIVANKGVRSLGSARTGRFAADMRVNVGGYGRADKTWGVDHPWHQTQSELFNSMSSRDRMEEGEAVREELRAKAQLESSVGASRASLKKKKNKLKKQGLSPAEAAAAALAEVERAKQVALEAAAREQERRAQLAEARRQKKRAKRDEDIDREIAEMARAEEALDQALALAQAESEDAHAAAGVADAATGAAGKKRKRVNRNKKRKEKLAALTAAEADDEAAESEDEESDKEGGEAAPKLDAKAAALQKAKKEKREKEKKERKERKEALNASVEERAAAKKAELAAREKLAKEFETQAGAEIATKSGLVIRDARLGKGKLPDVGEMCTVKYRGRLGKDGLVFGKGMMTTSYGTGSVIAGWEEGMGTMRPGGLRYLTIPPELGYGDSVKGGGKIPANSTLHFEVELVRLGKRKREAVGKDEMPLPKAFQRKKIKEKKHGGHGGDDGVGSKSSKASGKKKRRKDGV